MRASIFPIHVLILTPLILSSPAMAQVSVNLDALNPPAPNRPAQTTTHTPPPPRPTPARPRPTATRPTNSQSATARPATTPSSRVNPAPATTTPAPAVPTAPPALPVIAPVAAPAVSPTPSPQRPTPSASAGSSTTATPEGMRINFASGKSDLTPESAATLTEFAKKLPAGETVSVNVVAFAAGTPEDPSTARRIALARALAIRGSLMADGIASTRIYVRAMGAPPGGDTGPADRVDLTVLGAGNQAARAQATSPTAPARP